MFHHDLRHTGLSGYSGSQIGALEWSYTTGNQVNSSPAVGPHGWVYIGSWDKNFYCFDANGALLWSYRTGESITSSPAISSGDEVYVGSQDHNLYAFNSRGTLRWSYTTGFIVETSPAIGTDGRVFVGSHSPDNNLYAFTPGGALSWSYKASNDEAYSSPAIGTDYRIYVGSLSTGPTHYDLYALNSNGSLYWTHSFAFEVDCSPAIGADGKIYIGSLDRNLYAFNPNGTIAWSYETGPGGIQYCSPAIDSNGNVYIASLDWNFYSFSQAGALLWSFSVGHAVNSSPAIGSDGLIYFGSLLKQMYALTSAGGLAWSYDAGLGIYSSPAIDSSGRTIVGSIDHNVYVFGNTPVPPPPTPTPIPNYVQLEASPTQLTPGAQVTLSYFADYDDWGYEGAKLDIYIAAIRNPKVINGPSSFSDALSGGQVWLFNPNMRGAYLYRGTVKKPTYANVSFPPLAAVSSIRIAVPPDPSYAGEWVFATAFIYHVSGRSVRPGLPVENSNSFTVQ
jgi:outer membrane protein assembly factor BamB